MSAREPTVQIGPWRKAEIPPPFVVTLTASDGTTKLDLTGYTGSFKYRMHAISSGFPFSATDPAQVTRTAVVNADQTGHKGEVSYAWVAADFSTPGDYEGYMQADAAGGNGPIFKSDLYRWTVNVDLT